MSSRSCKKKVNGHAPAPTATCIVFCIVWRHYSASKTKSASLQNPPLPCLAKSNFTHYTGFLKLFCSTWSSIWRAVRGCEDNGLWWQYRVHCFSLATCTGPVYLHYIGLPNHLMRKKNFIILSKRLSLWYETKPTLEYSNTIALRFPRLMIMEYWK